MHAWSVNLDRGIDQHEGHLNYGRTRMGRGQDDTDEIGGQQWEMEGKRGVRDPFPVLVQRVGTVQAESGVESKCKTGRGVESGVGVA